jgi:hypothetical protein
MPINENGKQQDSGKNSTVRPELLASRGRKAPGTRLGTLADWREGSHRPGKISGRHGRALRDGR